MDQYVAAALDWYAFLASQPGWKAQAWHSVNTLARDYPQVFRELPDLLTAEMHRRRESADAAPR